MVIGHFYGRITFLLFYVFTYPRFYVFVRCLHFYGRISKNTFYVKSSLWCIGFIIKIAEFTTLCKEIITIAYPMFWIREGFSLTRVTKYTHLCNELIIDLVYVQHLFMLKYDKTVFINNCE